jgi:predicted enzyme related to lactoylglutathione lyase
MAKRKPMKKQTARKKPARKKSARKTATKRPAARRPSARRSPPRRRPAPSRAAQPATPSRLGVITHTELASADPAATKAWCQAVLGWHFAMPMETPTGPYHMWRFENDTGGGIRANHPPETPGSIPYCEVADIRAAFDKAIDSGATEMLAPEALPGGMGWIAIVSAPGGVAIGFWSMK